VAQDRTTAADSRTEPDPRVVIAPGVEIGPGRPLALIAGPCVLEDLDVTLRAAEHLVGLCARLGMPLIFKSSYRKDNRSLASSYRGPGLDAGLTMLATVKQRFGVPVLSDVHHPDDVPAAADVLDVVQIPAFLCRQTSLLEAAGRCARPVHVKKGQFMAPAAMRGPIGKLIAAGNPRIMLCERGTTFGYDGLINDFGGIPLMRGLGCPVVYDATHSMRRGEAGSAATSAGEHALLAALVRCGVAAGCDALFMETHPDPPAALCDPTTQVPLSRMAGLLEQALAVRGALDAIAAGPA